MKTMVAIVPGLELNLQRTSRLVSTAWSSIIQFIAVHYIRKVIQKLEISIHSRVITIRVVASC